MLGYIFLAVIAVFLLVILVRTLRFSPKPQPKTKKGYVCKVCGYVYEGDTLPADYICPLCKHGAEDFEPL